ncbi:uncharacterized protein BT62DRAFT_1006001 [Guyanagaster necrorhizus]|uniref:Uncharacterized protein n=1 Tax=Guyanagaster necrorhizus TaxID=856835 RepID=A0A9P8AT78_9AGAR|nr:uncharacterized protein BT62DRAFT_1013996 [Guyanagaster necrorhizus MCA 3950]XP_043040206.1 uncharacterized protein BT62DRAFT_1006001 [Guyanagaster necrorhizus MCA 3950]KAG7439380.1 hypothetical protein BT62DRAFT_1013996 [Guyanagaster necrorhizus MCA 3950]KAG7446706.1 hypothetical protein BT62DRAFT_1006001 [Guyanagaster necrorhizus MCA 3950]
MFGGDEISWPRLEYTHVTRHGPRIRVERREQVFIQVSSLHGSDSGDNDLDKMLTLTSSILQVAFNCCGYFMIICGNDGPPSPASQLEWSKFDQILSGPLFDSEFVVGSCAIFESFPAFLRHMTQRLCYPGVADPFLDVE